MLLRTLSLLNEPGAPDPDQWALRDFRDAVYYPVRSLLEGNNPYNTPDHMSRYPVGQHFPLYSPVTLLLHLPFGLLPFVASEFVYFGLTVVLSGFLAWTILVYWGKPVRWWQVFSLTAILVLSRPGYMNLLLGQSTLLAVLFSIHALRLGERRPWLSGLCLALSTFKPTFGVFLFLLMLARRQFKACLIGLTIGTLLTGVGVAWLASNAGGIEPLMEAIPNNSRTFDAHPGRNPLTSFSRVDLFALFSRMVGWVPPNRFEFPIAFAIVGMVGGYLYWLGPKIDRSRRPVVDAIVWLTMLIAIYHHAYDVFLIAVPSAGLIFLGGLKAIPPIRRRFLAVFLALPWLNYLATRSVLERFQIEGTGWTVITCLNGLALFMSLVILLASLSTRETSEK